MTSRISIVLALLTICYAKQACAGSMPPCVTATLSASGEILVINEYKRNDHHESGGSHRVVESSFRVFRRLNEVNQGLNLNGPDTYWSHPIWSVVFSGDKQPPVACSYVLVTNDAEYLILVQNWWDNAAMSIYRRRDHPGEPIQGSGPDHGVLIRKISVAELWSPEHAPETTMTDHTPQWYSGGTFTFSPDNKQLIHKTRWGKTLQIELSTGTVTSGKSD